MDISHWVAHRANWSPDRTAVRFEGADISYAAMEDRVGRLAGALSGGLGVGEGDRVAHLGLNSPELLELLFACARIGAILVPLNWRLTAAEHIFMCADCTPTAILVEPEYHEHVAGFADQAPPMTLVAYGGAPDGGWQDYDALVGAARAVPFDHARDLSTAVLLVYTSGTTGAPKGAVVSQRALFYNAINSAAIFDMTARDHILTALPMFHTGGMNIQTTPAIHAGATVTIHRRFDPDRFAEQVRRDPPSLFLAVPAVSQAITAHGDFAALDLTPLRCVCTGSSAVPEAVIRPWLDRDIPVTQVYGMTESGPVAIALAIDDAYRKVGSAGKATLHTEAAVVDDDGKPLPPDVKGEIVMRGPSVMTEYWNNPEATKEAFFPNGWFRSGDVAQTDADGFYFVNDRKKDMIISGGENIYPAELENVLADCAGLAEFAIVGRSDERWGEIPVACVVLADGARMSREDVLALFESRLARYKHPRDVVFFNQPLPRTSLGKVQKFALRKALDT